MKSPEDLSRLAVAQRVKKKKIIILKERIEIIIVVIINWPEYWEESWRPEETCCHSKSKIMIMIMKERAEIMIVLMINRPEYWEESWRLAVIQTPRKNPQLKQMWKTRKEGNNSKLIPKCLIIPKEKLIIHRIVSVGYEVQRAQTTIAITITSMCHISFSSLARSRYFSIFSLF